MRIVVTHDQAIRLGELAAAALPEDIYARPPAIPRDFITLDENVVAAAAQAHLAVVMDEIANDLAVAFSTDADAVVRADLVVGNSPALISLNRPALHR